MGNMGACVRVAAAADAAAVLTTGSNDPWHPEALRGAAGLHFALPVARVESLPERRQAADRDRSRGRATGGGRARPALDPRLRHRALRPQRGPARARRRPPGDPDARGGLQPQPGDRGCRRAFFATTLNLGRRGLVDRADEENRRLARPRRSPCSLPRRRPPRRRAGQASGAKTVEHQPLQVPPPHAQKSPRARRWSSPTPQARPTPRPMPGAFDTGHIKPGRSVAVRFDAEGDLQLPLRQFTPLCTARSSSAKQPKLRMWQGSASM